MCNRFFGVIIVEKSTLHSLTEDGLLDQILQELAMLPLSYTVIHVLQLNKNIVIMSREQIEGTLL